MTKLMVFRLLLFVLLLMSVVDQNAYAFLKTVKVTIKVVDEAGFPVEGANVGVGFSYNTGFGTNSVGQQGLSDINGLFTASGQGNGHISYGAEKNKAPRYSVWVMV